MSDAFRVAFDAIPVGHSEMLYDGRRWRVEKARLAGGRSEKLVAWELGGAGYVSLNLYALDGRDLLRPCEMPESEARSFVLGVRPGGQ